MQAIAEFTLFEACRRCQWENGSVWYGRSWESSAMCNTKKWSLVEFGMRTKQEMECDGISRKLESRDSVKREKADILRTIVDGSGVEEHIVRHTGGCKRL